MITPRVSSIRGATGQTKVRRYWPGKAPEWAEDHDRVDEDSNYDQISISAKVFLRRQDFDITKGYDRRLCRLAKNNKKGIHSSQAHATLTDDEEEVDHGRQDTTLEFVEEDEDAAYKRRIMIRDKLLRREQEERAAMIAEQEEFESEYETDSEDEQISLAMAMVTPLFVTRSERDTIVEREKIRAQERAIEESMTLRIEERKVETKRIVVEEIRKDKEIQKNKETETDVADVDTDDELSNLEEDIEAWNLRKIARLKRDREERDAMVKEKEEMKRVRNMTEVEREEWVRKNPKPDGAPKQKWRYMQRYYHKGAFFQDDPDDTAVMVGVDEILRRDYSAPTGEDKMDRKRLPKVMQVKHFGRSGRTKWTHLVNEDTTYSYNPLTIEAIGALEPRKIVLEDDFEKEEEKYEDDQLMDTDVGNYEKDYIRGQSPTRERGRDRKHDSHRHWDRDDREYERCWSHK